MDCPVCKNAMITLELEEVEIDHCTNCGGIWLDAGELELLLGQPEKASSCSTRSKSTPRPPKSPENALSATRK